MQVILNINDEDFDLEEIIIISEDKPTIVFNQDIADLSVSIQALWDTMNASINLIP